MLVLVVNILYPVWLVYRFLEERNLLNYTPVKMLFTLKMTQTCLELMLTYHKEGYSNYAPLVIFFSPLGFFVCLKKRLTWEKDIKSPHELDMLSMRSVIPR